MTQEFLTKRVAKVTFDATSGATIASHGTGLVIPKGAIVKDVFYNVRTTFTDGASDTATIALTLQSAGDIKAAISVAAAGNVWDAGVHAGLIGSPVLGTNAADGDTAIEFAAVRSASYLALTANRELTVTVAVAALTAGVMDIYVEYVV